MQATTTLLNSKRICFIGAGAMASAIVGGIIRNKLLAPGNIFMVDPIEAARQHVLSKFNGITASPLASKVLPGADIAVLAVKPQVAHDVMRAVRPHLNPNGALIISVMAGFTVADLQTALDGQKHRVIRLMPNTNLLAGHGCVGFTPAPNVTEEDEAIVQKIFGGLGYCSKVTEGQMLGVTGLAGSGPAYVASFIEALADAGVRNGLPRDLANNYALHTVFGSAKLLLEKGVPSTLHLKEMVCSPGGTTIAGIEALEKNGLRYAIMSAVNASAEKSLLMSKSKV